MSKLYGSQRRCHLCEYWTRRQFNLERHMERMHFDVADGKLFQLMREGVNQCNLHNTPIKYNNRQQLRRYYYFVHRADDSDLLIKNHINP